MKTKKILMILLIAMIVIPSNVFAVKSCDSYSVDKCPGNNCQVENGQCVKAHIGQNFCAQENVMNVMRVAGYFVFLMRLAIPFIIIIFGTLDLYKAVTGGDSKSLSSSARKLGLRCLFGLAVFLLPSIIHIVLSTLNDYNAISDDANLCQTCLLKPSKCENGTPSDKNPFDEDIFDWEETPVEDEADEEEEGILIGQ